MSTARHLVRLIATLAMVAGISYATQARAEYPDKAITVIVPYPAGGVTDTLARRLQEPLQKALGQPVVIDNRSGSAGHIGSAYVANAKPDGYTLLMQSGPTMTIGRSLYVNLGYDPLTDLRSVAPSAFGVEVIVARPDFAANNVKELVALAKQKPGTLTFASPGNGTVGHMTAELLNYRTGIDLVHVPYKGSAPSVLALLKGEVDLYFSNLDSVLSNVRAGKLKVIGNATLKRHPFIPDVATVAESGYPGFSATPWFGMWAPAKTPDAIVNRLNKLVTDIMSQPAIKSNLEEQGQVVTPMTPSEMDEVMKNEAKQWADVVEKAGLTKIK